MTGRCFLRACAVTFLVHLSLIAAQPTAAPTRFPTPLPTRNPTAKFSDVAGARHVVMTLHRGRKCSSEPLGYVVRGYSLGSCVSLTSPTPAPTPTRTPSSYRLMCRGGWSDESTYTVRQDSYYDSSCSLSAFAASSVLVHDDACTGNYMQGMAGGSARSTCVGGVLHNLITNREQLLLLSYSDSKCTAGGRGGKEAEQLVSLFLGVCLPFMRKGEHLVVDYHRRLTWIAGDGTNADIVLQSTLYSATDKQCSSPPTASETVIYQKSDSNSACVADPLIQNRYYARAGRSLNPRTDTAVSWASSIVIFGAVPSPAPTPTPTVAPTPITIKSFTVTSSLTTAGTTLGSCADARNVVLTSGVFNGLSVSSGIIYYSTFFRSTLTATLPSTSASTTWYALIYDDTYIKGIIVFATMTEGVCKVATATSVRYKQGSTLPTTSSEADTFYSTATVGGSSDAGAYSLTGLSGTYY